LPDHRRKTAAASLGRILARIHNAGCDAPDLVSKHILIDPRQLSFLLIDWPRARRRTVSLKTAASDLGRLDASLAETLTMPRDRLRCMFAYWQERGGSAFCSFRTLLDEARSARQRALRRRAVRELLRPPLISSRQRLRWIEGERLCVTRAFWRACRKQIPSWVVATSRSPVRAEIKDELFWQDQRVTLHRWPAVSWVHRCLARLMGRRPESARTRQAGLIFQLERHGVAAPRVLAFGRRPDGSGFLLTRPLCNSLPCSEGLRSSPRREMGLRQIGVLLSRMHRAGVRAGSRVQSLVVVSVRRAALSDVAGLRRLPRRTGRWPLSDLASVIRGLKLEAADAVILIRGYLGAGSSDNQSRALARALRGDVPSQRGPRDG
jgi:tRNA A-37 threonylcarbamoyl transferase component Bud32